MNSGIHRHSHRGSGSSAYVVGKVSREGRCEKVLRMKLIEAYRRHRSLQETVRDGWDCSGLRERTKPAQGSSYLENLGRRCELNQTLESGIIACHW